MPRPRIYRDAMHISYAMRYDQDRVLIYQTKLDELLRTNATLVEERNKAHKDLQAARAEIGSLRTRVQKLCRIGVTRKDLVEMSIGQTRKSVT